MTQAPGSPPVTEVAVSAIMIGLDGASVTSCWYVFCLLHGLAPKIWLNESHELESVALL